MFRIRTVHGPNDYAMMEEVLTRRIQSLITKHKPLADLVLIDPRTVLPEEEGAFLVGLKNALNS
jgi:hypothetical protein